MASFLSRFLIAICTFVLVDETLTQTITSPAVQEISGLEKETAVRNERDQLTDVSARKQRSPYDDDEDDYNDYNDYNGYDDYSDDLDSRNLKHVHKRKKHRKPLLLSLLGGQGGCRGHGCGGGYGWQPQTGGYNQGPHGGQGGSFASASAGSVGGSPHYGGGQSQANAQSASFSIGPYSATFSAAQASAGNKNDGIRDYYDY